MRLPNAILGSSPQHWTRSKAERWWAGRWQDERGPWALPGKARGDAAGSGVPVWEELGRGLGARGSATETRTWWWSENIFAAVAKHTLGQEWLRWLLCPAEGAQEEGTAACDTLTHISKGKLFVTVKFTRNRPGVMQCDKLQPRFFKAGQKLIFFPP